MTTVYWNSYKASDKEIEASLDLAILDIEPVLPHIIKSRNHDKQHSYLSCPAFIDYYKNTYVVRSPITTKLTVDYDKKYLSIYPQPQDFYDNFIDNRARVLGENDPFLMSICMFYLFVADSECLVEQLPVLFHDNQISNIRTIPGTFDISKWYRPLELAFEVIDHTKPIEITRGDPLFYVRFIPKDGGKVNIERTQFSKEQIDNTVQCVLFKKAVPKQPLKILYKLAEVLNMKTRKKCPFSWGKK